MTQHGPQEDRQREARQQRYDQLLEIGRKNPVLYKNRSFVLELRNTGVRAGRGAYLAEDIKKSFLPQLRTNAPKAQPTTSSGIGAQPTTVSPGTGMKPEAANTGVGARPTSTIPKQETRPPDGDLAKAGFNQLMELGKSNPVLFSNPNFARELKEAERRMAQGISVGKELAKSYGPERDWRNFWGGLATAVQDVSNGLGILGKSAAAANETIAAMDQRLWGAATGDEAFYDRANELLELSREAADRAADPIFDFGDQYRAETAELFPYAGPARTFVDSVEGGLGSLAVSAISNMVLPGSGIGVNLIQSFGGAVEEARRQGADESQAMAYGASVAVADTLLEKVMDGLGGVFGRGALDDVAEKTVRRAVKNIRAQDALISLAEMAGEGFEELLSEFTNELFGVHLLERDARTWQALLEDAGESAFLGVVVSGIVQGAFRLGAFADRSLSPREMGSFLANSVDKELRNPTEGPGPSAMVESGLSVNSDKPTLDRTETARYNEPVEIKIKRKKTWNKLQNAMGDEKLRILTEAKTVRTKPPKRKKNLKKEYLKAFGKDSIPAGYDLDHMVDLQLGGADTIENAWPLEKSVNRSLGKQIERAIRKYPYGTEFSRFYFED